MGKKMIKTWERCNKQFEVATSLSSFNISGQRSHSHTKQRSFCPKMEGRHSQMFVNLMLSYMAMSSVEVSLAGVGLLLP